MNSVVLTVGAILLVLFLIPLILILGFFVVMFILSCISGKYEYEYEQREKMVHGVLFLLIFHLVSL